MEIKPDHVNPAITSQSIQHLQKNADPRVSNLHPPSGNKSDKVEISENAFELFRQNKNTLESLNATYENQLINAPDTVKRKIEEVNPLNETENGKLEEVRKRIAEGYYSSPHVFNKIAAGLIREMKFE